MDKSTVFGNVKNNRYLEVGKGCGVRLLANIGYMDMNAAFNDELKKDGVGSEIWRRHFS